MAAKKRITKPATKSKAIAKGKTSLALVPATNTTRKLLAFGEGFGVGGGYGYDAASSGRRKSRNGSMLGPNLLTLAAWQQLIRASRDAIRNSPVAASAILKFQSNMVGTGIRPHFTHPDPEIKAVIQKSWDKWVKTADFAEQLSFYGMQTLVAAQLFEAGEIFCRYHVVDEDKAYFQLQLIETEQVPIYYNTPGGINGKDDIRMGIVFDPDTDKRVSYRMYKRQPYDVLGYSLDSLNYVSVPAEEMIHIMKPSRPGDLRGLPVMVPVLQLLEDLEGYADAERFRKRLSASFAFFIQQTNEEANLIPTATDGQVSNDPGISISNLEPGTAQVLLPGEEIVAPEVPSTGDYVSFMTCELRKFAAAVGLTYEQLTNDYTKVNYSSARVALLEFRRSAEQFQQQILIDGFCAKVLKRWMQEAVLKGALELPDDYVADPEQYEACMWVTDGWQWVDPLKEAQAAQQMIRDGIKSRSMVIRENGLDPETVENEIAAERKRESELNIITDTNANVVLIGKETVSPDPTTATPNEEGDQEADEATNQS